MPQVRSLRVAAIISNYAVTYGRGATVAERLFPYVRVQELSGIYNTFLGLESITDDVADVRAPGAAAPEVDWEKSTATFSVKERARRKFVPEEEAEQASPSINAFLKATELVKDLVNLGYERRIKAIVTNTANHGTIIPASGVWTTAATDIEGDIRKGKKAVRDTSGFDANTILIPSNIAPYLRTNTALREIFQFAAPGVLLAGDLPPTLFGLNVITPLSVYNTANAGQTGNRTAIWDGTTVEVLYIDPNPSNLAPTYGVTFLYTPFGVEGERTITYRVEERHGDYVEYGRKQDERLTFAGAGAILTGCSA